MRELWRGLCLLGWIVALLPAQQGDGPIRVSKPAEPPGFERYVAGDALGRKITFYLTPEPERAAAPTPLVVFVLGSGAHSNFIERGGRILDAHRSLREALDGRARLLVVEKPGVAYLSQPTRTGTAEGATDEFLREHTLERWAEAVSAALDAARRLPGVGEGPILVAGHSEGSRTAFRVAARNPQVTHLAGLAGFTASHLHCFLSDESWGRESVGTFDEPEERAAAIIAQWRTMLAEQDDHRKLFAGHSYRYWADLNASSLLDLALATNAALYIAQGMADGDCAVDGFRLLHAQLIERGRAVTAESVPEADHGFNFRSDRERNGWQEQMERTLDWFFGSLAATAQSTR